jgi:hypothetical protein
MALADPEKVDIRRFCGFPVFGGQPVQAFGMRFFQNYGTLEFRMNNMSPSEESVIRNVYLANLGNLETAIFGASDNLDTDVAAIWTHNKREVADRQALYDLVRRQLCQFLGIPPGPFLEASGGITLLV